MCIPSLVPRKAHDALRVAGWLYGKTIAKLKSPSYTYTSQLCQFDIEEVGRNTLTALLLPICSLSFTLSPRKTADIFSIRNHRGFSLIELTILGLLKPHSNLTPRLFRRNTKNEVWATDSGVLQRMMQDSRFLGCKANKKEEGGQTFTKLCQSVPVHRHSILNSCPVSRYPHGHVSSYKPLSPANCVSLSAPCLETRLWSLEYQAHRCWELESFPPRCANRWGQFDIPNNEKTSR